MREKHGTQLNTTLAMAFAKENAEQNSNPNRVELPENVKNSRILILGSLEELEALLQLL